VLALQLALAGAVGTVLLVLPASPLTLGRLSWTASVCFEIGAAVSAWQVVRLLPARDRARRFWRAYGAGALMITAGYLGQLLTPGAPLLGGAGTQVLMGMAVVTVVVVMCTYPLKLSSARARIYFWLDMATVMAGAGAFGWYLTGSGALVDILTGPVVMLAAVFAVTKLLLTGQPPFSIRAGLVGAMSPALGALTAAAGPALLAHGHGGWFFAASALADAFLMLAARVQTLQIGADPTALQRPRRRPYSTLPYVALAATSTLLAIAVGERGLDARTWIVLAGTGVSTGLVVVRQLASFTENARLLAELDSKVTELNRTSAVLRAALHERDVLAAQLHDMAFRDALTGLANRALFHDRMAAALARVRRGQASIAVMLLDLDDFKPVNDRYGHAAGDAVLREVAGRLRGCVRDTDTVARLGGDEFGVLLESPLPDSVPAVAERIVAAVRAPCVVEGAHVSVGVSVGVATEYDGVRDVDQLLRAADTGMYTAKCQGKGAYAEQ